MFQKTSQIRSGRKYSNVIEFWVLIWYKFNGIGLRFLFITSVFPPTTIEEDLWWVILVVITVGIILMVLLVPPRIHLFTYNRYIVIPVVGYANYILRSGPWCLGSPLSILIRRDNPSITVVVVSIDIYWPPPAGGVPPVSPLKWGKKRLR